jgi:SRSO17 transposase
VIPVVEPLQGWVDETSWLKQGIHSVGVSHKYCGAVGKQPQCQVAVELVVSDGEIAAPAGGAGFIGRRGGAKDQVLRKGAGVPDGVAFQTKPAVAGDLIEEALGDG